MKKSIIMSFVFSQSVFIILLPVWVELTKYLHPIVIGVVWFFIFFLALFGVCLVKNEQIQFSKHVLHILTFVNISTRSNV